MNLILSMPRRILLIVGFSVLQFVAFAGYSWAQAPSYARERKTIDSLITAEVAQTPIAGLAVAVVRGRDTLVMKGWGLSDMENDVAVTPASVFRIGSITKQFTSATIMQLVEKGALALTDTLGGSLPQVPRAWKGVTLQQLLNHTSGIPSYTDAGARWRRRWGEDMLPDTIIAMTAADTMVFVPGTRWRYDNTGYVLLGMILDRKTGTRYPRYLDEQLFKPLGLASTMYCYARPIIKHRAQGYDRIGNQFVNAEYLAMSQPYSAGALCSTVGDLVRWTAALHTGRVVNAASLRAMSTPTGSAATRHYGFGLENDTLSGHPRLAHTGGINGFASYLGYYPNDSLTIAVLSNTLPSRPAQIADNIAHVLFGQPLEGVRTFVEIPPPPAELAKYTGTYDLMLPDGDTLAMNVTLSGARLMAQATGQSSFELRPIGPRIFGADFDPSLRLTFTVAGDHATSLRLHQGGIDVVGSRRR